jgi:hypothetical protein
MIEIIYIYRIAIEVIFLIYLGGNMFAEVAVIGIKIITY